MNSDEDETFTVKDTKQLRKYLEKFENKISDFPNTTLSSHQFERMIDQLQQLHETHGNIDVKTILQEVTKASIFSVKEIECSYVINHGTKFTTQDGTKVIIRPLIPSDKERLSKAVESLSIDTLFMRFMTPIRRLSESQLNYLIDVDLVDHFAIGVMVDKPPYSGLAIARYIRDYKDPTLAEWAITVIDEYQGQHIGHILLYTLSQIAIINGIHTFRCIIHPTNTRMIKWMYSLGAIKSGTEDDESYSFKLPITHVLIHDDELKNRLDQACHGNGILESDYVKDCLPEDYSFITNTHTN